ELRERLLTARREGTVLSQQPAANAKLGPDQRVVLVVAAGKPPWLWAALGAFALAGAGAAVRWRGGRHEAPAGEPSTGADDLGGVSLRVTKDLGRQTVTGVEGTEPRADDEKPGVDGTTDAVEVRVIVDLGEQSVGPATDEGDNT
ncbi:MAG: hypothetical protein P8008_07700, partial [Gammaproteobacteria bacterium]